MNPQVGSLRDSGVRQVIFIDGTGKTYIENLILNVVRSHGDIALAIASLGIIVLLLSRG